MGDKYRGINGRPKASPNNETKEKKEEWREGKKGGGKRGEMRPR